MVTCIYLYLKILKAEPSYAIAGNKNCVFTAIAIFNVRCGYFGNYSLLFRDL